MFKCLDFEVSWDNQVEISSRELNNPASNSLKGKCSQVIVVEIVFLVLRVDGEKKRHKV